MSFISLYKNFTKPHKESKKIGFFRIILGIFGGLLVSYLAMIFFALLIPSFKEESLIIAFYTNTFLWACCILWISLSSTKLIALLRVIIPSFIFSILIFFLY